MALINLDKKKSGLLNPQEKMGLDEGTSTRESSNRVGKMVEGTTLGTPKTPISEIDGKTTGSTEVGETKKMKVKKKEVGVGAYQT
jgi:hypothetical protein